MRLKFGSNHTGIVQFAFGDGSIRSLRNPGQYNTTSFGLLVALGGKSGGQIVSFD